MKRPEEDLFLSQIVVLRNWMPWAKFQLLVIKITQWREIIDIPEVYCLWVDSDLEVALVW